MPPDIERDESGRPSTIVSSQDSTGPLGIWHWPLLSMIFGSSSSSSSGGVVVTEINRDDDGRIISMEEFEL